MSAAPAVAPLFPDIEQDIVRSSATQHAAERSAIVDKETWSVALCASVVIVGCLIACFVLMNWLCCVG